MSEWRHQALERLPEYRGAIEGADSPMALWIKLWLAFDQAVESSHTQTAERILAYARWCISEASGKLPNDTSTAAIVAFYEHIPTRRSNWKHLPKWLSPQEFKDLLPVFSYFLSAEEVLELQETYESGREKPH